VLVAFLETEHPRSDMACVVSPIPMISISPAPLEEPVVEPYSPFSPLSWKSLTPFDEGFRAQHLSPPPTITRFRSLSPLRPAEHPAPVKGLEPERFEALLQGARERNTAVGAKKAQDLRKEVAMKAHKNKQGELFSVFDQVGQRLMKKITKIKSTS
jgi:hypothetical protein